MSSFQSLLPSGGRGARAWKLLSSLSLSFLAAGVGWLVPVDLGAQKADVADFRVVVHPERPVEALPLPELSDIFFAKVDAWPDGREVVVVLRETDDAIRRAFDERVHGMTSSQVDRLLARRLMRGLSTRTEQAASDAEVLRRVGSEPGAVGYVAADTSLDGVKELPYVEMPERVAYRSPEYPPMAERARVQGVVVLRVHLDVEGNVDEVDVVEEGRMGLTRAAVEAVHEWRYEPSRYRGQPVRVTFKVAVRFRI